MFTKSIAIILLVYVASIQCVGVSPCPIANHNGTVHSGNIIFIQEP